MKWHKLKKVILPLLIIKILIFVFFIVKGDLISISRETANTEIQQGIGNQGERQKLIRIVRNEGERGITIKLRSRKNAVHFPDYKKEQPDPIID